MRRIAIFILSSFFLAAEGYSQIEIAPIEGLRKNTPGLHVLRGATIHPKPGETITNGVIIIRDGRIEKVGGPNLKLPANARQWDLTGKTIFAGFIDAASSLGKANSVSNTNTHWNSLVRPERRAAEFTMPKDEDAAKFRKLGFTTAHIIPIKGIFGGRSAAINLGVNPSIVAADIRQCLALATSSKSYPVSLMGSTALIRQTFYDANWYRDLNTWLVKNPNAERPESNTALAALEAVIGKNQPLLAHARDELDYARLFSVAAEFDLKNPVILGNGHEYRQIDLLKKSATTVIVPLNFPEAPPIEYPEAALEIPLEKLEHWERAPSNAAALATEGIPICLTPRDLKKPEDKFWKHIRQCVKNGLSPDEALAALTIRPANVIGLSDRLGTIASGKIANLVIASGDLFTNEKSAVHGTWVDGIPFKTDAAKQIDLRGKWTLNWDGIEAAKNWTVTGTLKTPTLKVDGKDFPIRRNGEKILILPTAGFFSGDLEGNVRLTGFVNREKRTVNGGGYLPGGGTFSWSATIEKAEEKKEDNKAPDKIELAKFSKYPAGAFGLEGIPKRPSSILIRNATIWTCANAGRLENADLLVVDGEISKIGHSLPEPKAKDALIIDAKGKHLTPGLVDCHSHSAIHRGINEGTHAVTVEVRVGDVVNPTDIALYRELAGGLTTASLLHGSANPMGGQNQVIKLRWGQNADGLRFDGAKPGVKFALGENVKQSNWDEPTDRYPQTRMGVEQIMKDTFLAARDYEKARAKAVAEKRPHRRNLRLEATLEILEGQRIVHIHSYRQDEILMFVRLAQEFGFTVGTFQHVLEGYKVADAIAEIGAGGSSFSDWWAYKFEVYDAIPYNGALLHKAGVLTSFNSDSNELATRLNTEAAKAVKYGGLSHEEALKFVTINPAIQLRIDDRVGSLEPGKDADFVIWSAPPLSSFARAEQTWIDGRRYFDLKTDAQLREDALKERERLIAAALPMRLKALAKKKAKTELDDDNELKPGLMPFLMRRGNLQQCKSALQDLYHNGVDTHTCTSNCCAIR